MQTAPLQAPDWVRDGLVIGRKLRKLDVTATISRVIDLVFAPSQIETWPIERLRDICSEHLVREFVRDVSYMDSSGRLHLPSEILRRLIETGRLKEAEEFAQRLVVEEYTQYDGQFCAAASITMRSAVDWVNFIGQHQEADAPLCSID